MMVGEDEVDDDVCANYQVATVLLCGSAMLCNALSLSSCLSPRKMLPSLTQLKIAAVACSMFLRRRRRRPSIRNSTRRRRSLARSLSASRMQEVKVRIPVRRRRLSERATAPNRPSPLRSPFAKSLKVGRGRTEEELLSTRHTLAHAKQQRSRESGRAGRPAGKGEGRKASSPL